MASLQEKVPKKLGPITKSCAEASISIPFRPHLMKLTNGNVLGAILYTQIIFRAVTFKNPFYKFKSSPKEKENESMEYYLARVSPYKPGDSWLEEFCVNRDTFDRAMNTIAHKINTKIDPNTKKRMKTEPYKNEEERILYPLKEFISYEVYNSNHKIFYYVNPDIEGFLVDFFENEELNRIENFLQVHPNIANGQEYYKIAKPTLPEAGNQQPLKRQSDLPEAGNQLSRSGKPASTKWETSFVYKDRDNTKKISESVSKETQSDPNGSYRNDDISLANDNDILQPQRKRRKLIPKKDKSLAASKKRAILKNIIPPTPKKKKTKPNKPHHTPAAIQPFVDAINNSSLRHHMRKNTAVYKLLVESLGKLIRGKYFNEHHIGCSHMIDRIITLEEFENALRNMEVAVHSPEHAPILNGTKEYWKHRSFCELLYNRDAKDPIKSVFAEYFSNAPEKLEDARIKVKESSLTKGDLKAATILQKILTDKLNLHCNNGERQYILDCVGETLPTFFESVKSRFLPNTYRMDFGTIVKQAEVWGDMLVDWYGSMSKAPHAGILSSPNTLEKAIPYFETNFRMREIHRRTPPVPN